MLKSLMAKEIGIGPNMRSLFLNKVANFNPKVTKNDDAVLDTVVYAPQVLDLYSPLIATWIPGDSMEIERVYDEDETSAI
jgi:hypothetical protein